MAPTTELWQSIGQVITLNEQNGRQSFSADDLEAALRSAIRAVLPGRQQKGNLAAPMDTARRAFVRTLRRRALG